MIIRMKDVVKLFSVSLIAFCAVFVCTLFLNFNIDVAGIKDLIDSQEIMAIYEAQVVMAKMISGISGGCLLLTSVMMLFFYIRQYIDMHRKELGILKALGYSRTTLAKHFGIFGFSIFTGTGLGFLSSYLLMPLFYRAMNEDHILPEITIQFHFSLGIWLVLLPTIVFGLISSAYAYIKLKQPVLELLHEKQQTLKKRKKKNKEERTVTSFLQELKKNTVRSRPALIFFIVFASFCYSAMMQTSISITVDGLGSGLFSIIVIMIGIILACVTLFLAVTTVVKSNQKPIAMMKALGYSYRDCSRAILNGYRPYAFGGFVVGTLYHYALIKIMLGIFASTTEAISGFEFNFQVMAIVFISFAVVYEAVIYWYSIKIKNISLKEIMLDA